MKGNNIEQKWLLRSDWKRKLGTKKPLIKPLKTFTKEVRENPEKGEYST